MAEPVEKVDPAVEAPKVDPDTEAALSLYRALKDPDTANEIVETLANKVGLRDKWAKDLTPKQVEKKLESLSAKFLREALGDKYTEFADKTGPAFDRAIEAMLNQRFGEQEAQTGLEKWEGAVDKFMSTATLTKEIEATMNELMADSPPNTNRKGFNAQKYLMRQYNNAVAELGIEAPKAPNSRASKGDDDGIPEFVIRDAPKNASIDDAIDAALKGIRFRQH